VEDLITLSVKLHKQDPNVKVLSAKDASAIYDDGFLRRGEVIVFNYTLIMQMLNFGILVVAMYGWFWQPLLTFLDQRRATIRSDIETAQGEKEKAQEARSQAETYLRDTRSERRKIIDAAQEQAQTEREELLDAARKETEGMIARAKKEIEAHVAAGKTELRKELTQLSVELAEKIIEREIREDDHAELVRQFIAEIETKAKEGRN
ncbi:MAG: F0F1 ATP synthase subunit B, partial [Planctomycetes bacterium]|nr:F0F1 ATP synthase subunit B [Planctomycetota bacterium]